MPKILKMPKPPPKAEKDKKHGTGWRPAPVSKTTALAEIILFPSEIPFIPGSEIDSDTRLRWLRLADDALDKRHKRKKA